jgi:competence protein ComFC
MLIQAIKDILFPVFCAECGHEGDWWCESCLNRQEFVVVKKCPVCGTPGDGQACADCRPGSFLDGALSFMEYGENTTAAKLLHDFKYCHARDVASVWKKIFQSYPDKQTFQIADCLVPVPLCKKRERERGYNQAEILADLMIGCGVNISLYKNSALKRARETRQQAKLTKAERKENVNGAFVYTGAGSLPDKVALVDDVLTSGATLNECARVLKENGVKEVWAITLARAV